MKLPMKFKKVLAIFSTVALIGGMIGCNNTSSNNTSTTLSYNLEQEDMNYNEINSSDFSLGQGNILAPSGKSYTYNLRGTIAAPKDEGKYPLVVIGHGSHSGSSKDRFDNGFKYLVDSIAQNGYVAISMDFQMHFSLDNGEPDGINRLESIYKEHMQNLKKANDGQITGHNIDLKNKIDFENTIFIGHSKNGQDMLLLADRLKQQGDNSIKGMISIAPAQVTHVSKIEEDGVPPSQEYYADIPTGIIVPEYDGDVSSLDGLTIYDKIINTDTERTSPISVTVLKGGKHNFFNTLLKEDTMFLEQEIVIVNKLNEKQHRDFLTNYTIDFLNMITTNNPKNTIFDQSAPTPNKMYGYDVVTKLHSGETQHKKLIDVTNPSNLIGNTVIIEPTVDHWIPLNDKIGAFRDPRLAEPINLVSLKWNNEGSSVDIEDLDVSDFSKYKTISLQVAQNPLDDLNNKENQGFSIRIKDKKNNESTVIVDKTNPVMQYIPGKITGYSDCQYYSNFNIIGEVRIPLEYFKGIDINNIKSLSIIFDQSTSGSIVVEDIQLN